MSKVMLIDAAQTEEIRVAILKDNKVEELDYQNNNKKSIRGNIYLAKVRRIEPSLQAAFVDYGGEKHGFLPFAEIHPDYYQIPVADREELMREIQESVKSSASDEEDIETQIENEDGRGRLRCKPRDRF